jgi:predicted lipoprotein
MRVAILAALLTACGSSGSGGPDQRRELLTALTDVVYLPTYRDFAGAIPALVTATQTLCDDPTEANQAAAQQAWRDIRRPWKQSEAFAFGPATELRLDGAIDFWPLRVTDVDEELAATAAITDDYIDGLGVSRKGLPVIEYLLFGDLARLHENGVANRGCDYLAAMSRAVDRAGTTLVSSWDPAAGNFRDQLILAGDGSDTYSRLGDAVNDSANAILIAAEIAEGKKLAEPLGLRDGDVPQPQNVESPFSDNSVTDLVDSLTGVRNAYTTSYDGAAGAVSYSTFVERINPALDADVRQTIDDCIARASAIEPTLAVAVESSPAVVTTAFDCSKDLLRLLKTDVAGILGVTPTFGDVDGD